VRVNAPDSREEHGGTPHFQILPTSGQLGLDAIDTLHPTLSPAKQGRRRDKVSRSDEALRGRHPTGMSWEVSRREVSGVKRITPSVIPAGG